MLRKRFSLEHKWGVKTKWVLSFLMLFVVVVPSIWMFLLDIRTDNRFLDVVDQGMRNDAMLFAEHLYNNTEHLLYEQYVREVIAGTMSPEATDGLVDHPFVFALGDSGTVMADAMPTHELASRIDVAALRAQTGQREDMVVQGYVDAEEGPMHFVYTLEEQADDHIVVRGARVNPDKVREKILPQAFARLRETISMQRGMDMFPGGEGGMVAIELATPDTLVLLSEIRPDWAVRTAAIDEMTSTFDLGGLFPDWSLRVACYNDAKANRWNRYLTALVPLLILVIGVFYTSRMAMREVELSQAKSSFVSNVSHELKMPLAKIQFFNELLQRLPQGSDDKQQRYHHVIDQECERLAILVDNVLDFNRIERGQMTYEFTHAPVDQIVREVIDTFKVIYEARGYSMELYMEEGLPVLWMDPAAIKQALINLLDNAVKYSEPHTIEVHVVPTNYQQKTMLALTVKDEGIGIANDKTELIFEEFYRVESGLSQRVSGSGLGLSIVRHIAEAHKGIVSVTSKIEEGSTFTLLLPTTENHA